MPPVSALAVNQGAIQITDLKNAQPLQMASTDVPSTLKTAADVESWITKTWGAGIVDYQFVVHVNTVTPLDVVIGAWNLGEKIPANWWL